MKENMNWPQIRYILWILGFLFLAFNGISFVYDVSQDAKDKTGIEQWVIGVSDVVGVSLVLAFWGWKWYKCQDYIRGTIPIPIKKISLYIGAIVAFFLIIIVFIKTVTYFIESAPEFLESQNAIRANASVTAKFGTINKMEPDDTGSSFGVNGDVRSGSYQFQVKGSSKDGVIRIKWHDEGSRFVPTEIDEILSPDTSNVLWTKG